MFSTRDTLLQSYSNIAMQPPVVSLLRSALLEDIGDGDVTTLATIPATARAEARFMIKNDGIVCGLSVAERVFAMLAEEYSREFSWQTLVSDGAAVRRGEIVATVSGHAQLLLMAERTALNMLQRMSGVATLTKQYSDKISGTKARLLDTRKTIPGWRLLDKYSVAVGGGYNHRIGLFDMIMIKDNHITAAGGISAAVRACQEYLKGREMGIEVETKNEHEILEALECKGVTRIMFDNFTPEEMSSAVQLVAGKVETEASGGITLETIRAFAETGVDYISVGALTHSAVALDISMKFS